MKQLSILAVLVLFSLPALCQAVSSKEKAATLAKEAFSKSKHKRKEKNGVVTEVHVEIIATPVIKSLSAYEGNYVYEDLKYRLEIRTDADKKLMGTLTIADNAPIILKNLKVNDAYFTATKVNADGSTEQWEGVFIDRNDGVKTEFGLGIKLSTPIQITDGLQITRIFFKRVSP